VLGRVQRGLETLYRVDTGVAVDDFVIDESTRDNFAAESTFERKPREQLLVVEHDGEMAVALFVDPAALANLARHDPGHRLGDHNLGDFLLAVEGVSHFIYAICCARAARPVTQLELELQAEIDKYVTCLLVGEPEPRTSAALRERLFGEPCYEPDLDADERERYRAANDNALRYAAWLEASFVTPRRIPEMLGELRRFYRAGLAGKLATIARAA
jgi:hypothetical protein